MGKSTIQVLCNIECFGEWFFMRSPPVDSGEARVTENEHVHQTKTRYFAGAQYDRVSHRFVILIPLQREKNLYAESHKAEQLQ